MEHIGTNDGLSQGLINGIVEDQLGYLWIATKDGLNRYDGNGFKVYRHDKQDPHSISENYVTDVFVDSQNRVWAATQTGGVNLLDRNTDRFFHFRNHPADPKSLSSDATGQILEDPNGNILIKTNSSRGFDALIQRSSLGLPSFDIVGLDRLYPAISAVPNLQFANSNIRFSCDGALWLINRDTLYRFGPGTLTKGGIPSRFYLPQNPKVVGLLGNRGIFGPGSEELYIRGGKRLLLKYDATTDRFLPFLQLPEGFSFDLGALIDRKNRIWIWQSNEKIARVDLRDGAMTIIHTAWGGILPSFRRPFLEMGLQDANGNIWNGTGGFGLLKISSRFDIFRLSPEGDDWGKNPSCHPRIVMAGQKGVCIPEVEKKWTDLLPKLGLEKAGYIVDSSPFSHLVFDPKGYFWFCFQSTPAKEGQLLKIDPNQKRFEIMAQSGSDSVFAFADPVFLDNQGDVWFGERNSSRGVRLFHLNSKTGKLEEYLFPTGPNLREYRFISDWYQEPGGRFWFATTYGVFAFDPATGKWQRFYNHPEDPNSLSEDLTLSICPDPTEPDRYLWVGTEGGGLNRLDKITGVFSHYTTENGLPNDVVYGILSDDRNNLWLSTNSGLCHFNPRSGETHTFNQSDGLPGNEFNRYQYSKALDGTLYFGGMGGTVFFHPEDLYREAKPSRTVISQIRFFNEPATYQNSSTGNEAFTLPAPIEYCQKLEFPHHVNMITLGFTLLDLTNPKKNHFKYKLEGLNDDWIEAGTASEVTFAGLSPRHYQFQVLGCNSHNVWSTEPATLQFTILAPWWATWWFRGIVLLLAFGILAGAYRYRLEALLAMERMRNRIAQDLHDEIGSTLSSISLHGTVIKRTADQLPEKTRSILDNIIDNTSQIMESMNDIVWAIKSDNDQFEQVVNRMRGFAVNMTEAKNILLKFETDKQAEQLELNMEQRKNFYLIFKEAVNNAVKYADASQLNIRIQYRQKKLFLIIEDDGKGFKPEEVEETTNTRGGNGLHGMKMRARQIHAKLTIVSAKQAGTRISLVLPLKKFHWFQ
ncbi:MAG: ATP-binding protein [Lewinellaceae bacterium]|nr:ATP-binding protein [Lewinellaceae bacterium]